MSEDAVSLVKMLLEIQEQAIRSGDWKVDGACDPDYVAWAAEEFLKEQGYHRDGLCGYEFIKD